MSIRNILVASLISLASLAPAHADNLKPVEGKSIDLGDVAGIAYYTVERAGFRVVTTLAEGDAGTPIRIVSILEPGQSVVLSTPHQAGVLEISREGDSVFVRRVAAATD